MTAAMEADLASGRADDDYEPLVRFSLWRIIWSSDSRWLLLGGVSAAAVGILSLPAAVFFPDSGLGTMARESVFEVAMVLALSIKFGLIALLNRALPKEMRPPKRGLYLRGGVLTVVGPPAQAGEFRDFRVEIMGCGDVRVGPWSLDLRGLDPHGAEKHVLIPAFWFGPDRWTTVKDLLSRIEEGRRRQIALKGGVAA